MAPLDVTVVHRSEILEEVHGERNMRSEVLEEVHGEKNSTSEEGIVEVQKEIPNAIRGKCGEPFRPATVWGLVLPRASTLKSHY